MSEANPHCLSVVVSELGGIEYAEPLDSDSDEIDEHDMVCITGDGFIHLLGTYGELIQFSADIATSLWNYAIAREGERECPPTI